MTAVIKVPGQISKSVGILAPVTTGLKFWHYPGVDAARTLRDFSAHSDGAIVGTPSYNPAYMQGGYSTHADGLQTNMPSSPSMTLGVVLRREADWVSGIPFIIGSREAATPICGLYLGGGGTPKTIIGKVYDASNTSKQVTSAVAISGDTTWELVFLNISDTAGADASVLKTYIPGHGETKTISYTGPRLLEAGYVRVGTSGDGVASLLPGQVKVAWAGGWDRSLTTDEMDDTYEFVKARLSELSSISVI